MVGGRCTTFRSHKFYRLEQVACGKFGKRTFPKPVGTRKNIDSDFCMYCGKTIAELRNTKNRYRKPNKQIKNKKEKEEIE